MFRFADPTWLLLLLIIPALTYWYVRRHRRLQSACAIQSDIIKQAPPSPLKISPRSVRLRLLALAP